MKLWTILHNERKEFNKRSKLYSIFIQIFFVKCIEFVSSNGYIFISSDLLGDGERMNGWILESEMRNRDKDVEEEEIIFNVCQTYYISQRNRGETGELRVTS